MEDCLDSDILIRVGGIVVIIDWGVWCMCCGCVFDVVVFCEFSEEF